MQTIDGRPVYAATDLVAYLACEHLTQLERASLAGLVKRPMRDDPELDIIRKRGFEHEKRYLADLEAEGRTAVTITPDGSIDDQGERLRQAAAATMQMIAARRDRAMPSVRSSAVMPRTHDPRSTLPPILQTVPCARTRPRRRISQ